MAAHPQTSTAVRGASLLIVLQVLSRLLTFLANQVLLRFLTAQQLGLATQLEVYYISVLFFSRESLRVAIQRTDLSASDKRGNPAGGHHAAAHKRDQEQAIVNLAYLPPFFSLLLAPFLAYTYHSSLPSAQAQDVTSPLVIYALACVVELLSEPGFALAQSRLSFGMRAGVEALATLVRCATTLAWVSMTVPIGAHGEASVFPFAAGQLAYGIVLLLGYGYYTASSAVASKPRLSVLPSAVSSSQGDFHHGLFHRPTMSLASSMAAQSVVKHVLTQGDTFLVSILSTPEAQGVCALANNYGGLLARMVFQPVEESSRSYFSRLLSSSAADNATQGNIQKSSSETETTTETKPGVKQALADLRFVLRGYILLSMPIVAFGPLAASPLLSIVAGQHWVDVGAGSALATYCYYLPLLAINGVSEAFVSSVATRQQVHVQSIWMGAFSAVFAAAGFVTLRVLDWGAEGLVIANSVNMACRIIWSARFITNYFRARGVYFDAWTLLPTTITITACLVAPTLTTRAVGEHTSPFFTLIKVGLAAIPFLGILAYAEREFLHQCYASIRGRRSEIARHDKVK